MKDYGRRAVPSLGAGKMGRGCHEPVQGPTKTMTKRRPDKTKATETRSPIKIQEKGRKQEPRQMGQQVKWPKEMKALDSFQNPNRWCDFHNDHVHKMEDCVALRIEVKELLKKGHLQENKRRKPHSRKEKYQKRQEWAGRPKRLLLGTYEISFTAKEQEKVIAPHHDVLVISLTVENCLVRRILVDNRSSTNIIFQTAYHDLGLEEGALTRKFTPLIGWKSGFARWMMEARWIDQKYDRMGDMMECKLLVVGHSQPNQLMIEVDRDGALLAGCVSLSSLANKLEWKDVGLRTPQDSMERRLDKSRCFGAASHKLKRLRTIVLRKLEN
ncbi:hypothetical protein F2Q69_00021954 [Brassica cretica]|uniref:Reverse transcriptase domain-containing protein n=1 Tax=Brassica cretica TaxID=69181 RepID=A0A8S9Q787_BRACR|nr:hypothetical protein F2Q69_00021954 [Brassica cretica]